MHASKIPIPVIAERLQRHRSTIYREIKRKWVHDEEPLYRGYYHVAANMRARARRQRLSKLSRKPALAVYVIGRLKAAGSPEQIAGHLRASGAPERLSHETIYRFVYPETARPLITFDRGTEFAYYALLKQKLGMDSYFCNPQAPW